MPEHIAMAKAALLRQAQANSLSQTETEQAIGRSAPRMLQSVGRVPMAPEREFV